MSWEPTVGTLSADDLYLAKITIAALGYADVVAHIDALTAQLERARSIAVSLEQELAQRGGGTWPMRQYATVELPPVAPPNDLDQYAIDGLTAEEAEAFAKAIEEDQ